MALLSTLMAGDKAKDKDGGDPAARLPEELRAPFNQVRVAAKRVRRLVVVVVSW